MADKQPAQERELQPSKGEADRMDWPVPGSDGEANPKPVATGFEEPIDAAAEASETNAAAPEASAPRKPDAQRTA